MKLKALIQRIAAERREEYPFPDNVDSFIDGYIPQVLLKSETLQKAFRITDFEMEELYGEAYEFYESENHEDSATSFRWLVLFNPFISKYWMGLGSNQMVLKQYEKALHSYACAALMDCENPYPHFYAGECYRILDNKEDAAKAFDLAYERTKGKKAFDPLRKTIEENSKCLFANKT